MNYIQVSFSVPEGELRDRLIADLSEIDCDAFEETEAVLKGVFPENRFDAANIDAIASRFGVGYKKEELPQQNWNASWESSFEPVTIPGFCTIRADFHPADKSVEHEIIVTPKMSFGTGHHATTMLMIQSMRKIQFEGRSVLDFGTGTGILAILARKLKAASVMAIDNDEWSVENATENIQANATGEVRILKGSLEIVEGLSFDIILANINRHILIKYMRGMRTLLNPGGTLILSGILAEDEVMITASALENGFLKVSGSQEGNWISVTFTVSP